MTRNVSSPMRKRLITWVFAGVACLGSGIGGYFVNDYSSFTSERRQELSSEYSDAQATARALLDDLRKFTDQARGKGRVTEQELTEFKNKLLRLRQESHDVALQAPEVEPAFEAYSKAMLELHSEAEKMSGPADAKGFIEALSRFLNTQRKFDKRVEEVKKDYMNSII